MSELSSNLELAKLFHSAIIPYNPQDLARPWKAGRAAEVGGRGQWWWSPATVGE
jgi:hypothetical protein